MTDALYETDIGDYRITTVINSQYRQNGYILLERRSGRALVIDPGGRSDDIVALVENAGAIVDAILLTHGHFDHLGAAHALAERWGIICKVHHRDRKLIRQAPLYALRLIRKVVQVPKRLDFFDDVDALEWSGGAVSIVRTPGHTQGSVCYVLPGMVFTGDVLLREYIGPTSYPGSDRDQLVASINLLLAQDLPGETVIFAGHGRPWTMQEARAWWARLEGPPPPYAIDKMG